MREVETYTFDGINFTTHPIKGEVTAIALKAMFEMLREDYASANKSIMNIRTYFDSGYNHTTQQTEANPAFGIEVEWCE
jgi:hypothetical protein